MAVLILVKHAMPRIRPRLPPTRWRLSLGGRRRCGALARSLERFRPAELYTSEEPKARQTAELLARRWGRAPCSWPGLHEHDRSAAPFLPAAEFRATVEQVLRQPERSSVLGSETGAAACARFETAVQGVLERTAGNVVLITHGTVIALLVGRYNRVDTVALWRQLELPSFVVVDRSTLALRQVVASVG